MKLAHTLVPLVEEYLIDAGFSNDMYVIRIKDKDIVVDFDTYEAVTYIICDIKKTRYKDLFNVSYKTPKNKKRHSALFKRIVQTENE